MTEDTAPWAGPYPTPPQPQPDRPPADPDAPPPIQEPPDPIPLPPAEPPPPPEQFALSPIYRGGSGGSRSCREPSAISVRARNASPFLGFEQRNP